MVYSSDRSKAVVPVLRVTLCCSVVYSTRRFVLCLALYYFVLVFFSPFSIAITSLGEEIAYLSAFRTFVGFALVWFCLFPLSLGVWEGLRLVIVALPGHFSYLFSIQALPDKQSDQISNLISYAIMNILITQFKIYIMSRNISVLPTSFRKSILFGAMDRKSNFANLCIDLMQNLLS